MKIDFPSNGTDYIKTHLKRGLIDHQSFSGSLNILLGIPEYARDPEINDLLVQVLSTKFLGYRHHAARILHAIGDPLGILHLTYNSVKVHPILGLDQTTISGWGELTARFPDALTDQCIDLLVEDMCGDHAAFHGGTLAYVPAEKIIPRMLPLLKEGTHTARYAAYVLAAKQQEDSLDVLEGWLQPENFKNWSASRFYGRYLPLWAARYFPHNRLMTLVREYANPDCELHRHELPGNARGFLYYAQYICDLNGLDESGRVQWMMNKYFKQSVTNLRSERSGAFWGKDVIQLAEPVNAYTGVWDRQLLIDATPQERESLVTEQRENLLQMLRNNRLGYDQLLDGRPCPFWDLSEGLANAGEELYPGYSGFYGSSGLRIIYEEADYVHAATDWILHPEKHLVYLEKPAIANAAT